MSERSCMGMSVPFNPISGDTLSFIYTYVYQYNVKHLSASNSKAEIATYHLILQMLLRWFYDACREKCHVQCRSLDWGSGQRTICSISCIEEDCILHTCRWQETPSECETAISRSVTGRICLVCHSQCNWLHWALNCPVKSSLWVQKFQPLIRSLIRLSCWFVVSELLLPHQTMLHGCII